MENNQQERILSSLLDTYKAFKEVCEKKGVRYVGLFGTGIGAVREKGFIPWDDDLDLGVFAEDMKKLIEGIEESEHLAIEIGREIQLQPVLKVYDKRFPVKRYGGNVQRYMFIDVFPMFDEKFKFKNKMSKVWWHTLSFITTVKKWSLKEVKGDEGLGVAIGYSIIKLLLAPYPTKALKWKLYNKVLKMPRIGKGENGDRYILDVTTVSKFNMKEIRDYIFEDTTMPMSKKFREDSSIIYKGDIMIRPEAGSHDHGIKFDY